jgi:hypothetical protein
VKLNEDPVLPSLTGPTFLPFLKHLLASLARQVNGATEGRIASIHAANTSFPTTGDWMQGDVVRNSTPTELGSAGSKYVITEWVCVASGTPGTWVAARSLTGN